MKQLLIIICTITLSISVYSQEGVLHSIKGNIILTDFELCDFNDSLYARYEKYETEYFLSGYTGYSVRLRPVFSARLFGGDPDFGGYNFSLDIMIGIENLNDKIGDVIGHDYGTDKVNDSVSIIDGPSIGYRSYNFSQFDYFKCDPPYVTIDSLTEDIVIPTFNISLDTVFCFSGEDIIDDSVTVDDDSLTVEVHNPLVKINTPFLLYPNPVKDQLNLKYYLEKESRVSIVLFNSIGGIEKILLNEKQNRGIKNPFYNIEELAVGVYYLTLKINDASYVHKVIKI